MGNLKRAHRVLPWALEHAPVDTPTERRILVMLATNSRDGHFNVAIAQLATRAPCSEHTAATVLATLHSKGLLDYTLTPTGRATGHIHGGDQ